MAFGLDVAIDSTGRLHVVYGIVYEFPPSIIYATSDGGAWQREVIADQEAAGFGATLVLDQNDVPHVAYGGYDNEVMYAHRTAGAWSSKSIAQDHEVAATSIGIDDQHEVHIAFTVTGFDDTDDALWYLRTNVGIWSQPEEVDSNAVWMDEEPLWDYRPAMVVSPSGQPHLAIHDDRYQTLRYWTRIDGSWQQFVVDDEDDAGFYPDLEMDDEGHLHFSGAAEEVRELRRFEIAPPDGIDDNCNGVVDG